MSDDNCDLCFHPVRDHAGTEGCTGVLGSMLRCKCSLHKQRSDMTPAVLAEAILRLYRALPLRKSQDEREAAMLIIEQAVLNRLVGDPELLERAAQ